MKIRVLIVGKIINNHIKQISQEYVKLVSRFVPIELGVVKEEKITRGRPVNQILAKEGERIQAQIRESEYVVILDPAGKQFSSTPFAEFIQQRMMAQHKSLTFIIGGPHGIDKSVKKRADLRLSLSKMTFAHELCIVVLLEQIYRGLSILHGSKYHK